MRLALQQSVDLRGISWEVPCTPVVRINDALSVLGGAPLRGKIHEISSIEDEITTNRHIENLTWGWGGRYFPSSTTITRTRNIQTSTHTDTDTRRHTHIYTHIHTDTHTQTHTNTKLPSTHPAHPDRQIAQVSLAVLPKHTEDAKNACRVAHGYICLTLIHSSFSTAWGGQRRHF